MRSSRMNYGTLSEMLIIAATQLADKGYGNLERYSDKHKKGDCSRNEKCAPNLTAMLPEKFYGKC